MASDPYYLSASWRAVCEAARRRSRGLCEIAGCGEPGQVFDHVVSRKRGGPDHPNNVRHLCRLHDNQVKEDAHGLRRSGGKVTVTGTDASGRPRDPNHPWNL